MQMHLREPGKRPQDQLFDTRLRGRSHGNGVAIAPQPGSNPKNVDLGDGWRSLCLPAVGYRGVVH